MSGLATAQAEERGCSSGVEHNLAKVGVEGSNPFARSRLSNLREIEPSGFEGATAQAPLRVVRIPSPAPDCQTFERSNPRVLRALRRRRLCAWFESLPSSKSQRQYC